MPAYFRPRSLQEALELRLERPVTILAGGTDVYPAKTARAGWGDMRHADVLDISAIEELRGVKETPNHFRFGSLMTWTELRRATLPPAFAGYQSAAVEVGGMQIQNRGTLVGNICTASPAGDGLPCLLTLSAEVELASLTSRRTVPVAAFVDDYRHTLCRPNEIVTALLFPKLSEQARSCFLKLGARRYLVISIAMVSAVVAADDDGRITDARIAVGACTPVAKRLSSLEMALVGVSLSEAHERVTRQHLGSLAPIDDIRASGNFRMAAAEQLVRDSLRALASDARREAA